MGKQQSQRVGHILLDPPTHPATVDGQATQGFPKHWGTSDIHALLCLFVLFCLQRNDTARLPILGSQVLKQAHGRWSSCDDSWLPCGNQTHLPKAQRLNLRPPRPPPIPWGEPRGSSCEPLPGHHHERHYCHTSLTSSNPPLLHLNCRCCRYPPSPAQSTCRTKSCR